MRRYIGTLDLGVLQDMDGIRKKASAKWARQEVSFNKPLNLKPFDLPEPFEPSRTHEDLWIASEIGIQTELLMWISHPWTESNALLIRTILIFRVSSFVPGCM